MVQLAKYSMKKERSLKNILNFKLHVALVDKFMLKLKTKFQASKQSTL